MVLESLEQRVSIKALHLDNADRVTISIRPLTPTDVLERLAFETWHRLRLGKKYHVHQGEETITDVNLLEIALANLSEIKLWKCPKADEGKVGIDWEWF